MIESFDRIGRTFGTGFCFLAFGISCFAVAPTLLPAVLLWPGTPTDRQRRVRSLVGAAFRALLWLISLLRLGRVQAEGLEYLRASGGQLILASHPTFLDVVALIALHPQADCVVKSALWRNPFTRSFVRAAGYISNADPIALIEACVNTVQTGGSLVIFPEGTRSVPGKPLRFKRGAAQIAVRAKTEIVPVLVACMPPTLTKQLRWYQVPDRPWNLRIRVLPVRRTEDFIGTEETPTGVRVRQLTRALQGFFQRQLIQYERTY